LIKILQPALFIEGIFIMFSNFIGYCLQWRRINRLLFLLLLAVFALSPVLDAYLDSLYCSPGVYQYINDSDDPIYNDNLKRRDVCNHGLVSKRSSKQRDNDQTLGHRVLRINGSQGRISKPQLLANGSWSSQRYSFVSSDPSPPVV